MDPSALGGGGGASSAEDAQVILRCEGGRTRHVSRARLAHVSAYWQVMFDEEPRRVVWDLECLGLTDDTDDHALWLDVVMGRTRVVPAERIYGFADVCRKWECGGLLEQCDAWLVGIDSYDRWAWLGGSPLTALLCAQQKRLPKTRAHICAHLARTAPIEWPAGRSVPELSRCQPLVLVGTDAKSGGDSKDGDSKLDCTLERSSPPVQAPPGWRPFADDVVSVLDVRGKDVVIWRDAVVRDVLPTGAVRITWLRSTSTRASNTKLGGKSDDGETIDEQSIRWRMRPKQHRDPAVEARAASTKKMLEASLGWERLHEDTLQELCIYLAATARRPPRDSQ